MTLKEHEETLFMEDWRIFVDQRVVGQTLLLVAAKAAQLASQATDTLFWRQHACSTI